MSQRVTMTDVARQAGVSVMTVSRAINRKPDVSPATRQRVLEIAERLGYRPDSIARGLATKHTGTIGLVVPDVANPFFSEVARGAEHVAYAEGYNVFLCNTDEDLAREVAVLRSLEEKRVDGIVLCSSRLEDAELRAALVHHSAVVLVNRRLEGDNVSAVLVDDEAGGRMATQHLLQSGHQAIGFLAGPPVSRSGRLRLKGYCSALALAGLSCRPDWMPHCSPTVEGGRKAARELLTKFPEMTALFCYNDLVAIGALRASADLGRRVPHDLAVVGADDIPLAALVTPSLTTCRAPRYELGSRAMRLLLDLISGRFSGCEEVVLQPELVVRASAP
nr:LacI family DNA-binding transcriptional regulator [Chloroflexota bacterium]